MRQFITILNLVPLDHEAAGRDWTLLILSGIGFGILRTKRFEKLALLLLRMKEVAGAAQMRRLARSDWNIFVLFSNSTFMGGQLTKGPAGRIYIVE